MLFKSLLAKRIFDGSEKIPLFPPNLGQKSSNLSPTQKSSEAVILDLNKDVSISKLEKHLDDYRKGKGYLSKNTAKGLSKLDFSNATSLSETNPAAMKSYLSYSTAFNYANNSRFVHSVNETTKTIQKINSAQNYELPRSLTKA